mmetsp:Transcript_88370/g.161835  ORF Transcript_88370/g.161835 Transcript_88370/m.161835 type:complete len:721 (-) Transcript_88370:115-2277(-)
MLFHEQTWMNVLVSPIVFWGLPIVWVFGVFAVVQKMMTSKAVNVKFAMQVYNMVQIAVCSYMVWGLLPCIGFPNVFGISTEFNERGEWFVFVHYLSKYLDWFDTLWIVLNKKRSQLSFLHIYHHATIVSVWGLLLSNDVGSGGVRYGAFINSLTHVIMYSHYLWTSFGLKNPLKRYITMWQISQFYSCLAHAFLVMFFDTTPVQKYAWIQVLYQTSMVYLFTYQMSWVPECVPDMSVKKDEGSISCMDFFLQTEVAKDEKKDSGEIDTWKERYIVIRGKAYDITNFNHPGGAHMIDLGAGRDATVMFESGHMRLDVALKALEKLPSFSIEDVEKRGYNLGRRETFPTPSQSDLYETLRKRVLEEVCKPRGMGIGSKSTRGVPAWHIASVILTWVICATWFVSKPSIISGIALGLSLSWVGTGVQHTANHGGICKDTTLGYLIGLLDDLAVGGSSIVWRYHHQVSHHAYCNDIVLDQDTHSSYPVVRMDSSQEWHPMHKYQWIYGPISFCFLYFSINIQDLTCLLTSQSFLVSFRGTSSLEILFGIFLKFVHFYWLFVLPYQLHGFKAMLLPWCAAIGFGGFALAAMFIVSHNVDETKVFTQGDWARQQIETSTSWGGAIGSFFSGGLNLQIEHHLFPCMAHHLYPEAQKVVQDECAKRGIRYSAYPYLLHNFIDHVKFLYQMGKPDPELEKRVANKPKGPRTLPSLYECVRWYLEGLKID